MWMGGDFLSWFPGSRKRTYMTLAELTCSAFKSWYFSTYGLTYCYY